MEDISPPQTPAPPNNSNMQQKRFTMSRWAELKKNPEVMAKVVSIYGAHFPIEVRYFLAEWIEAQNWSMVDPQNPQHEQMAQHLLTQMLEKLKSKADTLTTDDFLLLRLQFEQTHNSFQEKYMSNPLQFVQVVRQCLEAEEAVIPKELEPEPEEITDEDLAQEQQNAVNAQIMACLSELSSKTMNQERKLMEMQNKQENFIIQYQENIKLGNQLQQLNYQQPTKDTKERMASIKRQKDQLEQQLSQQAQLLLQHRINLNALFKETIDQLQMVQKKVLDEELISWKRRQQLAGNGLYMDANSLNMLQSWCEQLAEVIWNIRQQIKKTMTLRMQLPIEFPPNVHDVLPDLSDIITGLLSSLVTSTFIVETQPPQVLKKDSRFSATVRLLVGGKLNVHMNPPHIKATIISEHQAKMLLRSDVKMKDETSGDILNNTSIMEYQAASGNCSGYLSAQFRNMQLKRIKRSDKKGSEAVTEEKFCILFQSDFNVGGNDLVFQVWTLSLPVVVTVHGNQECNALGTILWDNAFSEPGRIPFVVPEAVPWPSLGEQLNLKFKAAVGRGLSEENLNYLASKIFGLKPDYTHSQVTWAQFNKDTLKDRSFTFWEWFYYVLKLTKEHLKGMWCDGSIMGFVSKQQAQEKLNMYPSGTFLLRFSDSECGGITIAWIADNNTGSGEREVWNLAPFISRDFVIRGLADRIKDLNNLTFLYPRTPKNEAFSKYYDVKQEQPQNGYIRPHLVNVISMPNNENTQAVLNDANPNTPLNEPAPQTPFSVQSPQSPHLSDLTLSDDVTMGEDFVPYIGSTDYEVSDINVTQFLQAMNPQLYSWDDDQDPTSSMQMPPNKQ